MKQYLTILLRTQFNLFYRFGYTYIPKCQLLEFDGEVNQSTNKELVKLFLIMTPFEWEEEYLIIHFESDKSEERGVLSFQIQDIVKVYPLSAQAKSSIETKIDQRIKLEKPNFENILPEIEREIEKHEITKAIEALWKVCGIQDDWEKFVADIDMDNILKGQEKRRKGIKCHEIKGGNYWEYVIAYDRVEYYPNSDLGYFYDASQIFANTKGFPSFEGSKLHKTLEKIKISSSDNKIKGIIELLKKDPNSELYLQQTTDKELLRYLITPLYLKIKDEIRNTDNIKTTSLFKSEEFGDSFKYALILLGAFFGFKKFYDVYYDNLNLRFYKSHQPLKSKNKEIKKDINESNSGANELDLKLAAPYIGESPETVDTPKSEQQNSLTKSNVSNDLKANTDLEKESNINPGNKQEHENVLSDNNSAPIQPRSNEKVDSEESKDESSEKFNINNISTKQDHPSIEKVDIEKENNPKGEEAKSETPHHVENITDETPMSLVEKEDKLSIKILNEKQTTSTETDFNLEIKKIIHDLFINNNEMEFSVVKETIKKRFPKVKVSEIEEVIKAIDIFEIISKKSPKTVGRISKLHLFR